MYILKTTPHGISNFNAMFDFDWENALIADRTRHGDGEQRFAALGLYAGKMHTVVFTKRNRNIPDHKPEAIRSKRGKSV